MQTTTTVENTQIKEDSKVEKKHDDIVQDTPITPIIQETPISSPGIVDHDIIDRINKNNQALRAILDKPPIELPKVEISLKKS